MSVSDEHDEDLEPYEKFHKDGSLWARGHLLEGTMHGYWEFFRVDGTLMRSGSFNRDVQVGEWTTYDKSGAPYKVTQMKGEPDAT
jgi:antitoxin component YwqK of YwqJK toxin-antitoxin module